jgi:hypothetical protein
MGGQVGNFQKSIKSNNTSNAQEAQFSHKNKKKSTKRNSIPLTINNIQIHTKSIQNFTA